MGKRLTTETQMTLISTDLKNQSRLCQCEAGQVFSVDAFCGYEYALVVAADNDDRATFGGAELAGNA